MHTFKKSYQRELTVKQKIMMTLLILLFCRILAGIPVPFVNRTYLKAVIETNTSLGLLNSFTGGGLSNLSVMALGITPYITASIIIQLMSVVIPKIQEMQRGMVTERKYLEKVTIIFGCILAALQGTAMSIGFGRQGLFTKFTWYAVLIVTAIWASGTLVSSLLGKRIQDKYIGNGISLILVTNILSSYPSDTRNIYETLLKGASLVKQIAFGTVIILIVFLLFLFTVVVTGSEKRIKVNYSGKVTGNGAMAQTSTIPIKLCPGNVVPVIFASTLLSIPQLISMFTGSEAKWMYFFNSQRWFDPNNMIYTLGAILYIVMIFGFTFFYTNIEFNTVEIADNIRKQGGTVPGVRTSSLADYLKSQMKYTLIIGAIALSVIAMIPVILGGLFHLSRISFLGTSIIITVGVIQETQKTLQSIMRGSAYRAKKGGIFRAGTKK